jgi:hypothetical protein
MKGNSTMNFSKRNAIERSFAVKHRYFFNWPLSVVALAFAAIATTLSFANDAMKINSTLPNASAQSMKQPQATRVNDATTIVPKNPALPSHSALPMQSALPMKPPATTLKPPLVDSAAKATFVAPSLLGNAITGLGDDSRGIVAGESLVIRGRGFGAVSGRVDIAVQTSASSPKELSFRVSQWSDTEIRGSVGASLGFGDNKAAITIYPAGKSVTEQISSGHVGVGATRSPWRFNFTATRVEQTIPASAAQPDHLSVNLAEPAAREIKQGGQLLNGIAYSRIRSEGSRIRSEGAMTLADCPMATPQDRFKLKLASEFDLVRVNGRDLNAGKRYGLLDNSGACDIRSTIPAAAFVQSARDGGFVVNSTWDVVNRLGAKATEKSGRDCSGSRYLGVTKTPLGFDWDNTRGTDRCAANAEYIIESFTVRGPAGLNPFFGTSAVAGGTIK